MLAIDTNVVVRYITNDHPAESARARKIIDTNLVFVPLTVLLESEWVLRSTYGFARAEVSKALRLFAGLPGISIEKLDLMTAALDLAERGVDLADAVHLCAARHCEAFVTFDKRLMKKARSAVAVPIREP